jgi:hypothetical protein
VCVRSCLWCNEAPAGVQGCKHTKRNTSAGRPNCRLIKMFTCCTSTREARPNTGTRGHRAAKEELPPKTSSHCGRLASLVVVLECFFIVSRSSMGRPRGSHHPSSPRELQPSSLSLSSLTSSEFAFGLLLSHPVHATSLQYIKYAHGVLTTSAVRLSTTAACAAGKARALSAAHARSTSRAISLNCAATSWNCATESSTVCASTSECGPSVPTLKTNVT